MCIMKVDRQAGRQAGERGGGKKRRADKEGEGKRRETEWQVCRKSDGQVVE